MGDGERRATETRLSAAFASFLCVYFFPNFIFLVTLLLFLRCVLFFLFFSFCFFFLVVCPCMFLSLWPQECAGAACWTWTRRWPRAWWRWRWGSPRRCGPRCPRWRSSWMWGSTRRCWCRWCRWCIATCNRLAHCSTSSRCRCHRPRARPCRRRWACSRPTPM